MTEPALDDVAQAEVRAYYKAGLTAETLAERYGVSDRTIRRALDVRRRTGPRTRVSTAEIVRLHEEERLTWPQVAAATGMTETAVAVRYSRHKRSGVSSPVHGA